MQAHVGNTWPFQHFNVSILIDFHIGIVYCLDTRPSSPQSFIADSKPTRATKITQTVGSTEVAVVDVANSECKNSWNPLIRNSEWYLKKVDRTTQVPSRRHLVFSRSHGCTVRAMIRQKGSLCQYGKNRTWIKTLHTCTYTTAEAVHPQKLTQTVCCMV